MTITVQTPRSGPYNGDGSTVAFAYGFLIDAETELVVVVADSDGTETTKVLTTDYTVSGVGNNSGGTVTFGTAPASGETVAIRRSTAQDQGIDLATRGAVDPEVVEGGLDELTKMVQDLQEQLGRAALSKVTGSGSGVTIPAPGADGTFLGWSAGQLTNLSNLSGTTASGTTDQAIMRYVSATGDLEDSLVTIDDNGYVNAVRIGIGVSPATLLHLSDTNPIIRLVDEDGSSRVDIRANNSHALIIDMDPDNADAATSMQVFADGSGIANIGPTGLRIGSNAAATLALQMSDKTDAVLLPRGTTAQRPGGGSPDNGLIRYNSSLDEIEVSKNNSWYTAIAVAETLNDGELFYIASGGLASGLPIGSTNEVLTVSGAGFPTWSAAASAFISSSDFSNDATAEFTLDLTNYDVHQLHLQNVVPQIDAQTLWLRTSTDGGSTFDSGASDYAWGNMARTSGGSTNDNNASAAAQIELVGGTDVGSAAGEGGLSGTITIYGPQITGDNTMISYEITYQDVSGTIVHCTGSGARLAAEDVDALQILFSGANLETGTITHTAFRSS